MTQSESFGANDTPYQRLGGEPKVRELAERFYDAMDEHEPELARLHPREEGRVSRASRDRFALFLVGWLGGPQEYMRLHGHPRLRLRHAHVPIDSTLREAWMRCMRLALNHPDVDASLRAFLEEKLGEVATFLQNQPG